MTSKGGSETWVGLLLLSSPRSNVMAKKYGRKAATKVARAIHERKQGTLKSGRSQKRVKSRKQAIAIGLSEARREGARVPPRPKTRARKSSRI
jgi:hypothetical protein